MKVTRMLWAGLIVGSLLHTQALYVKDCPQKEKVARKEKKNCVQLLKKTIDYTVYAVGIGAITYIVYCYCNKKEMNIEQLQTEFVEKVVQQADKKWICFGALNCLDWAKFVVIPAWIINSGHIGSAIVKTVRQTAQDKVQVAAHYLEQTSTALKETGNHCVKLAQESLDQSGAYLFSWA